MKRYLLFVFTAFYPDGGWRDYAGSFDTLPEAVEAAPRVIADRSNHDAQYQVNEPEWHVVDRETGSICASSEPEDLVSQAGS